MGGILLKVAAIGFAFAAFAAGLRSAWVWYCASRVQIVPMFLENDQIQTVDPYSENVEWVIALLKTAQKAGRLNREAAAWTAVTIVLTTLSTLIAAV